MFQLFTSRLVTILKALKSQHSFSVASRLVTKSQGIENKARPVRSQGQKQNNNLCPQTVFEVEDNPGGSHPGCPAATDSGSYTSC